MGQSLAQFRDHCLRMANARPDVEVAVSVPGLHYMFGVVTGRSISVEERATWRMLAGEADRYLAVEAEDEPPPPEPAPDDHPLF